MATTEIPILSDLNLHNNQIKNAYLQGVAKRVNSELVVKLKKGGSSVEKRYSGLSETLVEIGPETIGLPAIFEMDTGETLSIDPATNKLIIPTVRGLQGVQGPQGLQGLQGKVGPQGTQGLQGLQGLQGIQGTQGTQGTQGEIGWTGAQGLQGIQGVQGVQGVQGLQGLQGLQGIQGVQGTKGEKGDQGIQGPANGPQGIQGTKGEKGSQGASGQKGDPGRVGPVGMAGPTGPIGPQGVQGPKGETPDLNTTTVNFTKATDNSNIISGETLPTLFGKIENYFGKLSRLAYKDQANWDTDIANKPTDLATTGDISNSFNGHNSDASAHPYIQNLISTLSNVTVKLNKLVAKDGINIDIKGDGTVEIKSTIEANPFILTKSLPSGSDIKKDKIYLLYDNGEISGSSQVYVRSAWYWGYDLGWRKIGSDITDIQSFLNTNYYSKTEIDQNKIKPIADDLASHKNDPKAHPNLISNQSIALNVSNWTDHTDQTYKFKYSITINGMTPDGTVWVSCSSDSVSEWNKIEPSPSGDTTVNTVTIYAKKKPTKDINLLVSYQL